MFKCCTDCRDYLPWALRPYSKYIQTSRASQALPLPTLNVEVLLLDAKSPTVACAEQRRVPLLLPARLLFSKIIIPANDLSLPSTIIIARCDARAHPEELFGLRLSEALDTHDSTSRVKPVLGPQGPCHAQGVHRVL